MFLAFHPITCGECVPNGSLFALQGLFCQDWLWGSAPEQRQYLVLLDTAALPSDSLLMPRGPRLRFCLRIKGSFAQVVDHVSDLLMRRSLLGEAGTFGPFSQPVSFSLPFCSPFRSLLW